MESKKHQVISSHNRIQVGNQRFKIKEDLLLINLDNHNDGHMSEIPLYDNKLK